MKRKTGLNLFIIFFMFFSLNSMLAEDSTKTNQSLPIIGKPNKHILNILGWKMLYSDGNNNAFTSITWYKDKAYVAFRQGTSHGSWDGREIILRSDKTGKKWGVMAALHPTQEKADARDPKLLTTPEGLFCFMPTREKKNDKTILYTEYSFSKDGERWSKPKIAIDGMFLFWVKWHNGKAYASAYTLDEKEVILYISDDGRKWKKLSTIATSEKEGGVNETTFDFASDGTCWAVVRGDLGYCNPLLVHAKPPYKDWEGKRLTDISLKPNTLWIVNDRVFIAGRWFPVSDFRSVAIFEVKNYKAELALILPSGGDLSYMSVAPYPDNPLRYWMVYYSTHRYLNKNGLKEKMQPSDIFFTEIEFLEKESEWKIY